MPSRRWATRPQCPRAPYYAAKNTCTFMTIMGGLRTSADMEVCDEDDEPIPGLFNVGCMVGDMYANELPHPPRRPRFLMPPPLVVRDHPPRGWVCTSSFM